MAKKCDICGRSATRGASRSHSKIRTLKRQNINLQAKNIDGLKLRVCTSCLRTRAKKEREAAAKIVENREKALKVKAAAPKKPVAKKASSKVKRQAKAKAKK